MLDFDDASGQRTETESQNELTDIWSPRGMTVSWWAFHDSNISYITTGGGDHGWFIDRNTDSVRFNANTPSAFPFLVQETVPHSDNTLYHWVVTWTGVDATGQVKLYQNGVSKAVTDSLTGNGVPDLGFSEQCRIGTFGTGAGEFSLGGMGLWSRVISRAEITGLSLKLSPAWFPNELRAYWKIDEIEVEQPIVGKHALRMIESPPRSFRLGSDLIEPVGYILRSHEHNPVDLAPAADTVFTTRRQGYRVRKAT